jgi:hypothetical protein
MRKSGIETNEQKQLDIDSLTAIHRLRRGNTYPDIESCCAIFVTTNSNLVRAAFKYFSAEYERTTVPLAIRSDTLTTIAWLKHPVAAPDLPRKTIIAECYAAMKPPERLWRVYLSEIDKLTAKGRITENDYNLLRYSIHARSALMDFTLGSAEGFTEGTVAEVLAVAQNAIRAESAEALAQADKALQAERELRVEAETEAWAGYDSQLTRARDLAVRTGQVVQRAILSLSVPVIIAGIYFTLPRPFVQPTSNWIAYCVPGVLLIVAALTATSLFFGTTVKEVARKIELTVANGVERTLLRLMKPQKPGLRREGI